jgi:hypothetical protein
MMYVILFNFNPMFFVLDFALFFFLLFFNLLLLLRLLVFLPPLFHFLSYSHCICYIFKHFIAFLIILLLLLFRHEFIVDISEFFLLHLMDASDTGGNLTDKRSIVKAIQSVTNGLSSEDWECNIFQGFLSNQYKLKSPYVISRK